MQKQIQEDQLHTPSNSTIWFVYDGLCPLCRQAARALRIREAVGRLELVDARVNRNHPVVQELNCAALDLDKGMVIKYGEKLYHGADALHMMAVLGSKQGWFNRMNATLYRSPRVAALIYPAMKAARNFLVLFNRAGKIRNLQDGADV